MFKIRKVTFKEILNIPSLDISPGLVTTLFGESGSGKTTLMKLLNQMTSYDGGAIYYNDRLITDLDPIELRREVVMLSQTPAIFDGNIRDNLLIGRHFSGKKEVDHTVLKHALERVHLNKNLNDRADPLSGGEKQRLAFARVFLMDAKVFLMDEPTSALDEKTESGVMDHFINYVKEKKKTVIMVTHSRSVAERYSDLIIKMDEVNQVGGVCARG